MEDDGRFGSKYFDIKYQGLLNILFNNMKDRDDTEFRRHSHRQRRDHVFLGLLFSSLWVINCV